MHSGNIVLWVLSDGDIYHRMEEIFTLEHQIIFIYLMKCHQVLGTVNFFSCHLGEIDFSNGKRQDGCISIF